MRKLNNTLCISITLMALFVVSVLFVFNDIDRGEEDDNYSGNEAVAAADSNSDGYNKDIDDSGDSQSGTMSAIQDPADHTASRSIDQDPQSDPAAKDNSRQATLSEDDEMTNTQPYGDEENKTGSNEIDNYDTEILENSEGNSDIVQAAYTAEDDADAAESGFRADRFDSEQIMSLLANSLISDSGTYAPWFDREDYEYRYISSFGKQHTNCFSINTGASFNMWGGGTQFASFNVEALNEFDYLQFTICGENGTSGEMDVSIYIDREMEGTPDYNCHFSSCTIPETVQLNINGARFISIVVNNLTDHENRMVFYDLEVL